MDFSDVVRARRMIRTYDPARPVPREVLAELLDLAVRAPSAGFSQGWSFVVLTTEPDKDLYWTTAAPLERSGPPDRWLRGMQTAPVLVLCLSEPERYLDRYAEPDKGWEDRDRRRWPVPYWDVDTGMAAMVILLGATDKGLASCFFGVPSERQASVLENFGASSRQRIVGVIALGYPAAEGDRRSPSLRRGRRPKAEVLHEGRFGTPFQP